MRTSANTQTPTKPDGPRRKLTDFPDQAEVGIAAGEDVPLRLARALEASLGLREVVEEERAGGVVSAASFLGKLGADDVGHAADVVIR